MRVVHGEEMVIAHNEMGYSATDKVTITVRSASQTATCSAGCGTPSHKFVIMDNWFWMVNNWVVRFTNAAGVGYPARGEDALVEGNFWIRGADVERPMMALHAQDTDRVTVRNNIVVMNQWFATYYAFTLDTNITDGTVNHNTCYVPDEPGQTAFCVVIGGGPVAASSKAYNNLLYAPNAARKVVVNSSGGYSGESGTLAGEGGNMVLSGATPFVAQNPTVPLDFRLAPNASTIDAGFEAGRAPLDFLGLRRLERAPDVGALEFGSGDGAPPASQGPPRPPVLLQ